MSNQLNFYDSEKLEYYLRTSNSLRQLVKIIRKDHSVLSREIRRNSNGRDMYRAVIVQKEFEKRKTKNPELNLDFLFS